METRRIALIALLVMAGCVYAQTRSYPQAKVSFDDFKSLVAQVEEHRAKRLVDLNTFLAMSKEHGTIILDSRSDFRFERLHLKGAKHLSFTDFTQANLASVIPGFQTRILIYCNNNFEGNQTDLASKVALPASNNSLNSQIASQAKPIMMALNIPSTSISMDRAITTSMNWMNWSVFMIHESILKAVLYKGNQYPDSGNQADGAPSHPEESCGPQPSRPSLSGPSVS